MSRRAKRQPSHIKHVVICGGDEDDCEQEIEVRITPGSPAQTYGPPERCSPGDPWDIEIPETCPRCGRKLTDKDAARWLEEYEPDDDDGSGGDRDDD